MHLHTYRLLTESPAKKKAKKLIEIVELMGFTIKLSRSQELTARLMGYESWLELLDSTRTAPQRGVPDHMLPPKVAALRRQFQIPLLIETFGIDDWDADILLRALAPTGEASGRDAQMIETLGLRLTGEDAAWIEESMTHVRSFDTSVRALYSLGTAPGKGLTHVRLENLKMGLRQFHNRRATTPEDIVEWVARGVPENAPLEGKARAQVTGLAKSAHKAFSLLDGRIRTLGSAPMIAPVDWTFLMLFRAHVSAGDSSYYTALSSEPWLHIGFDLPHFSFNPENEWGAARALCLQMALRREFLDSGWTEQGPEWKITFRDGNSSKEDIKVRAQSAGAAYAWAAAARGALRIAKQQTVNAVSLVSVIGPDGPENPEIALVAARNELVIRRGKLINATKLKIRSQRQAA